MNLGRYVDLNRVLLMVIHKGNCHIVLLNAINAHAHLAAPGADL